jgi:hypothetical protein
MAGIDEALTTVFGEMLERVEEDLTGGEIVAGEELGEGLLDGGDDLFELKIGDLREEESLELGGVEGGMDVLDGGGEEGDVFWTEELIFEGEGFFFFMHGLVPYLNSLTIGKMGCQDAPRSGGNAARCCPEGRFAAPNGAKGFVSGLILYVKRWFVSFLFVITFLTHYLYLNYILNC